MLVAIGGLDGRQDLARDAELGKGSEGRRLLEVEIAHGFEEANHPLLNHVFPVGSGQEVRAGLGASEVAITREQRLDALLVAFPNSAYEIDVVELREILDRACEPHLVHRHAFPIAFGSGPRQFVAELPRGSVSPGYLSPLTR
jgi:hypothetical protein